MSTNRPRYRFGSFELDTVEGTLARNGNRVKLQDLPYRLLVLLVEREGEIVTREEVRQRLWTENTFVDFDNSLGVAIRKIRDSLGDDADAPRYIETIPRRGFRFLAPVTVESSGQPDSSQRTARESVTVPAPGGQSALAGLVPHWRHRWVVAALVLLLLGGCVLWFRSVPRHAAARWEASNKVGPPRMRRSVAVLGFRNLPGRTEDNWLSPAFAEMLNTELSGGGGLRMVSGEDVARAKRDLPLTDEDSLAKATLARLQKNPGADYVVVGSYTLLPGPGENRIRLDVRLQDTARGETITEQAFTGNEDALFELATQAGGALRRSLGAGSISPEAANQARAALPSNQRAVRLYSEAQTRLWAFDQGHARDLLLQAIAADPNYPLAHAALAQAWGRLGYTRKALAESERALALSANLSQEERLLIEGQHRYLLSDYPKAVEVYRRLFNQYPDSLDYGLRLSEVQRWISPADSLRTLATLRQLPPPAGDDPRIDINEASAWMEKDLVKAQAAAKRAIAKGTAEGSHLLVARAYGILCETLSASSTEDAIRDCENARQSYAAAGDRDNEARSLSDFGGLYYQLGDIGRAEAMFREAAKVFRQVGDVEGVATTTSNLGDVFLAQGNLIEARKLLEDSIPSYQATEDKDGVALVLNDLGDLARLKGDLETAQTTYQQAKATAQEIDDKDAIAYVLSGLGDVYVDRGDLSTARKYYEESLGIRQKVGEKQAAAETQVAIAIVSIEEGHSQDAEQTLRQCKAQFHQEQQANDELVASTALVRSLLNQEKYAAAQQEVLASTPLSQKSQNRYARLQFDLISAEVELASGHSAKVRAELDRIAKDAHEFPAIEFEIKLTRAELESKAGSRLAARTELAALEKNARAKGFGLIASKAAAAEAKQRPE